MPQKALIVVDIQRDFLPGGALPVKEGNEIIEPVNGLVDRFYRAHLPVFFTRDWHPSDHLSFRSQGGVWPPHCVKGTPGARFPPSLHVPRGAATVVSKATRKDVEAYSGFQGTDLAPRLRKQSVGELFVVGLATDYCVKNTVIDGMENGFQVTIVTDCVRGVNLRRTDSASAFRSMTARGARETTSGDLVKRLGRRAA
ncbi:MAG: isochorismatase family protein [Nitrososphaerales archaeon]